MAGTLKKQERLLYRKHVKALTDIFKHYSVDLKVYLDSIDPADPDTQNIYESVYENAAHYVDPEDEDSETNFLSTGVITTDLWSPFTADTLMETDANLLYTQDTRIHSGHIIEVLREVTEGVEGLTDAPEGKNRKFIVKTPVAVGQTEVVINRFQIHPIGE